MIATGISHTVAWDRTEAEVLYSYCLRPKHYTNYLTTSDPALNFLITTQSPSSGVASPILRFGLASHPPDEVFGVVVKRYIW